MRQGDSTGGHLSKQAVSSCGCLAGCLEVCFGRIFMFLVAFLFCSHLFLLLLKLGIHFFLLVFQHQLLSPSFHPLRSFEVKCFRKFFTWKSWKLSQMYGYSYFEAPGFWYINILWRSWLTLPIVMCHNLESSSAAETSIHEVKMDDHQVAAPSQVAPP